MIKTVVIISLCLFTTALAVSPSLVSFNGGQVSPLMEARVDFQKYSSSLRTLENMLVTVQGPVERRPGTKYIASQGSSTASGRIFGFEDSTEDSYILLFEDRTLRFFTNGGQVLAGAGTEDLSGVDDGALVAHWLFNDSESTTAVNADNPGARDGSIKDSADGAIDASVVTAEPKVGTGSFDLDGQYTVQLGSVAAFSFTDNTDDAPFSIVCWAFVSEADNRQVLFSKWQDRSTSSEYRLSLSTDRRLRLELTDTSASIATDRVAQWFLNDNAANTAVDDDVASIPHDGILTPSNTQDVTAVGKTNMTPCFDFAGTEAVEVSDHADLSFGNGTTDDPFSISAWIYVEDADASQTILSKWNANSAREWMLSLNAAEQLEFRIINESTNVTIITQADNALTTGWHFVCSTYLQVDFLGVNISVPQLYVDGTLANSTRTFEGSGNYIAMEDTATGVAIGANYVSGSLGNFFQERIDNVILFDVELTQANVTSLYNNGEGTEDIVGFTIFATSDDAIDLGWHFFASTYDATDNGSATAADGIILYVDGVAVDVTATNDAGYTAMQDGLEEARIGSHRILGDTATDLFWADKMDEVSLFSDVLTPTEVASLFTSEPYEIATPYLTAELTDLDFKKNDDVMFIAHPDYNPKQLIRVNNNLWTLENVDFQTGPFLPENDTSTTIASDGLTGNVVLTASADVFKSITGESHVGSIWQFNQVGGNPAITGDFDDNGISLSTAEFEGGFSFTTEGTWEGNIVLQRSTNNGVSWRNALVPLAADTNYDNPDGLEEDGAMYRTVMSNYSSGTATYNITVHDEANRGVVRITGVESGTSATATVLNNLVSTSATTQWREGYWSDFRGWPESVTVHQQRLVFGGSESFPQTVWFGKQDPDEYENFLEGTLATSSFTVALEGQNQIRWLLSQDYMLIGTSGTIGKWGEQGKAVTPTSPNYQEQTRHGSAAIQAGLGGDAVLYIERGSRKVRQFSFDLQVDKYLSPDVTILSPEITESGIVEISFQLRPDPILWCVLGNGDMATLTYQRDQSIAAWTKQITDGDFTSVAVIPGQAGTNEDEVWVIVERVIDSNSVFYIEQFQPQEWGSDDNDAWFVDSGISYNGVATDTFTGADHLEGETVSIYADLLIESPEIVVSGGFTIDNAAERVLVGMAYTSKFETLPLVIDPQDRAANKKVKKVSFDVYRTGAFKYGNGANSTLTTFNFKNNLDLDNTVTAQDLDVGPATSIVKPLSVSWVYGSMKKQTIYVESDEPMPLTLRAITTDYKFYGN